MKIEVRREDDNTILTIKEECTTQELLNAIVDCTGIVTEQVLRDLPLEKHSEIIAQLTEVYVSQMQNASAKLMCTEASKLAGGVESAKEV